MQYEEGDPALQFMQEFWHVTTKQGSNLLNLESLFAYPGTTPPWSATERPWVIPAGTDFAFRNGSPSVLTRGTLLSTATVRWDSGAGRVKVAIRTTDALPAAAISPPSRLLLGPQADVAWVEGDQTDTGLVNFLPGASPGSRTGYIEVWDAGGLFASDLFNVALGQRPVAKPVPDQTLFTGAGVTIPLNDHFTDPDGDALTYVVTVSRPHYVTTALIPRQTSGLPGATYAPGSIWFDLDLRIHAQTVGDVVVTVVASDAIGLTETLDIAVTIEASDVLGRTALIGRTRVHETIQRYGEPVGLQGGDSDTVYPMYAIVDTGNYSLGVAAAPGGGPRYDIAVAGPTRLTISDVDFRRLTAVDQRLLGQDNLDKKVTEPTDGFFGFRGESWNIAAVEQRIEGQHLLSHTFTLDVVEAVSGGLGPLPTPGPAPTPGPRTATPATQVGGAYHSGPSWYTLSGGTYTFNPPDGLPLGDYTFVFGFRDQRGGVSSQTVVVTVTAVVPTLAAVSATKAVDLEAGAAAVTVDVSSGAWYTAAHVTPTYALSSAPSWITLSGSTLTIAPGASVTPQDYTATITATGTGVADVPVTLTVTVTAPVAAALPSAPGNPWVVALVRTGANQTPRGADDGTVRVYVGTATTFADSDFGRPASIAAAVQLRALIDGVVTTYTVESVGSSPSRIAFSATARYGLFTPLEDTGVTPSRPTSAARWIQDQEVQFLDTNGNVITDGPTNV